MAWREVVVEEERVAGRRELIVGAMLYENVVGRKK